MYKILQGDPKSLEEEVNSHIANGWRPQGGVSCWFAPVTKTVIALQAVFKEEEEEVKW